MIYVFDLDGTLCEPQLQYKDTRRRYEEAIPIPSMIKRVERLHSEGHRVIIHTARRMVTHQGDINKIVQDVGEVTETWLEKNKVPYHELVFGKPYGDYYIDDKAITIESFQKQEALT